MQYAVSDIHGCYDKYIQLLHRLGLKDSDTLYVLGDMIDRGPDGLKILMDISMRPNVVPFLGNHEYAALTCLPWLMEELTEENTERMCCSGGCRVPRAGYPTAGRQRLQNSAGSPRRPGRTCWTSWKT